MNHSFTISISRKPGLSDPEGTTTARALEDLGFSGINHVTFGRVIVIDIEAESHARARQQIEEMCLKLLANPVIEEFSIKESS